MAVRHHIREVKTALRKQNLSESFLVSKYRFSPYHACEHGCLYCDGRAEKYYVQGVFDRDIVVRSNIDELLSAELPKLREKGFISMGSGVSDVYQPTELRYQLSRHCGEILLQHNHPVILLTKSALSLEDVDLWAQMPAGFTLAVSLTTLSDNWRQVFEPRAASVQQRLELIEAFKRRGCCVGVLAMPLVPFLTDTDDSIEPLYRKLAELGVDFIIPSGLTLRSGRQKDVYLETIERHYPQYLEGYRELYHQDLPSGAALSSYYHQLMTRLTALHQQLAIPQLVPHKVYRGQLHNYDAVHVLLFHMLELYGYRGVPTDRLKKAVGRFEEFIKARKQPYNRRRSWSFDKLEQEFYLWVQSGELGQVLANEKLDEFVRQVVLEDRVFDYNSLQLVDE